MRDEMSSGAALQVEVTDTQMSPNPAGHIAQSASVDQTVDNLQD